MCYLAADLDGDGSGAPCDFLKVPGCMLAHNSASHVCVRADPNISYPAVETHVKHQVNERKYHTRHMRKNQVILQDKVPF